MIVPLFFLFGQTLKIILYVVGIFVNILVNYLIKIKEKQIAPIHKNKKIKKYRFYEYDVYGYPSEKIQNIGYAVGFMAAYLTQNLASISKEDQKIIAYAIISFYFIFIIVVIILSETCRNTIPQMISGKVIGLIIGIIFFKLSEPKQSINYLINRA
jgi:hypothetical protein